MNEPRINTDETRTKLSVSVFHPCPSVAKQKLPMLWLLALCLSRIVSPATEAADAPDFAAVFRLLDTP